VLNNALTFKLGLSHSIVYVVPSHIEVRCVSAQELLLFGLNLNEVSQVSSNLTRLRLPDIYKGKGLYRSGCTIRRLKSTK